jgi:hypothetical protein
MTRQAAQAIGLRALGRLALPKRAARLRLGTMLTFASAPAQAAAAAAATRTPLARVA